MGIKPAARFGQRMLNASDFIMARPKPPQNLNSLQVPSGAPTWVTVDLLERTLQVWQPYYDCPLTPADALAMIQAASGLIEVLSTGDK